MRCDYREEPPEVRIADGVVTLEWRSGAKSSTSLRVFRITHARATAALAEYDAREADVRVFERRFTGGK